MKPNLTHHLDNGFYSCGNRWCKQYMFVKDRESTCSEGVIRYSLHTANLTVHKLELPKELAL